MIDLISRKDAIDAVYRIKRTDNWKAAVLMMLFDVPSAESTGDMDEAIQEYVREGMMEPVGRGFWIEDEDGLFVCSECDIKSEYQIRKTDFCPNCGGKMAK